MTAEERLVIDVTREERERIEEMARQHSCETPDEYLLALIDMQSEEPTKAQVIADLRQSLYEIKTG